MRETVEFPANEPVELSLAFPEGKIVAGRFGDRVMYSLEVPYGKAMFLDMAVAQKINLLEVQPGELFFLCKRPANGSRSTRWDVWLSPVTEQARAARERKAAASQPPPLPAPSIQPASLTLPTLVNGTPIPPEQPSLLERQLVASIAEVAGRKVPASEAAPVERGTGTNGPAPAPKPALVPSPAAAWVSWLVADTNALVDAYAQVLERTLTTYQGRVKPDDVRSLLLSAYINRSKGASHGA